MPAVDFVFSFRSPYSRIAAQRIVPRLPAGVDVRWRPFFPLPSFGNFGAFVPAKRKYVIRDVVRLMRHYELALEFPKVDDCDWAVPHAAFVAAAEAGRGPEFASEAYDARWARGEDLGEPAVIERAAAAAGLDGPAIASAALDPGRREAVRAEVERGFEEEDIFGVPTLILPRGTRFWGHDRIEWALREGLVPGPDA